ncbi:MAG TPA: vWA domain-containing protein [Planctomycetota bacterium]|nr:vWA domain-containing protein [Planctomycetota bacterium]
MARELARAPWFLISLALHVLVLLLLGWLFRSPPVGQVPTGSVEVLLGEADEELDVVEAPREEVEIEVSERDVTEEPQVAANWAMEPVPEDPAFDHNVFTDALDTYGLHAVGGRRGQGAGDDLFNLGSEALRRGSLRGTVARLRESGLEIVFVFDSTGSMQPVLSGAKRRIARMVEVLHALVPAARIGIVTYRDRGKEAYVVRSIPVTHDVYRVINFMHTIDADGGGDFPEAVLDGLRTAVNQRWLPGSRRVVVLIGDAPPHRGDLDTLHQVIKRFARGQAFVHAIATSDRMNKEPHPDTRHAFEAIARIGNGQYGLLEGHDTVLEQVLALAFGNEHRRDLDEIYAIVAKRTERTDVEALDIVHRGDLEAVERALRKNPVDDEIVKAAIRMPNPKVTRWLVERLGDRSFPPHARQACSFAVMQILGLGRPPLDPESNDTLRGAALENLLSKTY